MGKVCYRYSTHWKTLILNFSATRIYHESYFITNTKPGLEKILIKHLHKIHSIILFHSLSFSAPDYLQLSPKCPREIVVKLATRNIPSSVHHYHFLTILAFLPWFWCPVYPFTSPSLYSYVVVYMIYVWFKIVYRRRKFSQINFWFNSRKVILTNDFFLYHYVYYIYLIFPCISKHGTWKCFNFAAGIIGNVPFFSETFENRVIVGISIDFPFTLESTGCIFSSKNVNLW